MGEVQFVTLLVTAVTGLIGSLAAAIVSIIAALKAGENSRDIAAAKEETGKQLDSMQTAVEDNTSLTEDVKRTGEATHQAANSGLTAVRIELAESRREVGELKQLLGAAQEKSQERTNEPSPAN